MKKKYHPPHFLDLFELVVDGKTFASVCMNPVNAEIFGSDIIQLKIENARLYEIGWLDTFKEVIKFFSWKMENVSRLDIALDGKGFLAVANLWHDKAFKTVSRAQFKPNLDKNMNVTAYHLGGMCADRNLKCYDKTRELEVSNKYYIRDFWQRSGLDTSTNVERLEVSLRNEYVKTVENFNWRCLDNFEYLASLMRTSLHKFYQFYYPDENKNISRCKKFDFIDWQHIGGIMLAKNTAIITNEVSRFKQASKTLFLTHLSTGQEVYLSHSRDFAINANCLQWWIDKQTGWRKEYDYKTGNNRDGVIHYPFLSSFREYTRGQQISLVEKFEN